MRNGNIITVFCDGGSRGNPGEAAYGFVVFDDSSKIIYKEGKRLGIQTNNFAEYSAVISALLWLQKNNSKNLPVSFFLDSMLVVEQLSGNWKIKSENIRNLYFSVKTLERSMDIKITYAHVRREKNKEADKMVNLALDNLI